MHRLNDLRPDESGIIIEIRLTGSIKQRMADLGVTVGAKVTMLRTAPFGDPIEFRILGYNLCLRQKEANKIIIEKVGEING